jgi:MYXO-CTERM domain-containing protein
MRRLRSLSLPGLLALLAPTPAFASPTYPPTIQAQLGLAQTPDCTLCHRDDNGGIGTVVRPFGRTLVEQFGLTGGSNTAALKAAIEGDDAEHLDSDGDGVPDIDELRAGTNPNVGASGVATALLVLVGVGLVVARRRRSRTTQRARRSAKNILLGATQLQTAAFYRGSGEQQ